MSADAALIRERVFTDDTDVVCLTETQRNFVAGTGHAVVSEVLDSGSTRFARRSLHDLASSGLCRRSRCASPRDWNRALVWRPSSGPSLRVRRLD
jgi:hypothetical protein